MAITAHQVSIEAVSCEVDGRGNRTYTVPYDVFSDSGLDGPGQVITYLAGEGVFIGAGYDVGNDADILASLKSLSVPQRMPRSKWIWRVVAKYSYPEGDEEGETPGGERSTDPEDWRWRHQFGAAPWQEPCYGAWNHTAFPHPDNLGALTGKPYTRSLETFGPVVNSAGVVLDPTLMRDEFDLVWQVTAFTSEYDSRVSEMQGSLNDTAVRWHPTLIDHYAFRQREAGNEFPPYRIKCTQAGAVSRVTNVGGVRVPFWEWSFEFRFRVPNWLESVLDRGITARAAGGDPDGSGGQFPSLPSGTAPAMPIVDGSGRRVPELVLFDGAGHPMDEDHSFADEGFYFAWRKDVKRGFAFDASPAVGIPFEFFTGP